MQNDKGEEDKKVRVLKTTKRGNYGKAIECRARVTKYILVHLGGKPRTFSPHLDTCELESFQFSVKLSAGPN